MIQIGREKGHFKYVFPTFELLNRQDERLCDPRKFLVVLRGRVFNYRPGKNENKFIQ